MHLYRSKPHERRACHVRFIQKYAFTQLKHRRKGLSGQYKQVRRHVQTESTYAKRKFVAMSNGLDAASDPLSLIKHHVSLFTVFRCDLRRLKVSYAVVIEASPTPFRLVLGDGRVMTATQRCTMMEYDSIRVVHVRRIHCWVGFQFRELDICLRVAGTRFGFALWCDGWFHEGSHVETLKREVHRRTEFARG